MTNTGCLNLRGKDGSQSSITVRCVYLPASFFNACSSDYLRTERLFLQRPFASQMVSPVFSHFAAVLLEIRNIAFFIIRFSNLTKGRVFLIDLYVQLLHFQNIVRLSGGAAFYSRSEAL